MQSEWTLLANSTRLKRQNEQKETPHHDGEGFSVTPIAAGVFRFLSSSAAVYDKYHHKHQAAYEAAVCCGSMAAILYRCFAGARWQSVVCDNHASLTGNAASLSPVQVPAGM